MCNQLVKGCKWTVPCISSWKDMIILRSIEGHPILCNREEALSMLVKLHVVMQMPCVVRYNFGLSNNHLLQTNVVHLTSTELLDLIKAAKSLKNLSNTFSFSSTVAISGSCSFSDVLFWL